MLMSRFCLSAGAAYFILGMVTANDNGAQVAVACMVMFIDLFTFTALGVVPAKT
jgi:hypothetical protein